MSFKDLADSWTNKFPHSQSKWIQSLCDQVRAGAMWNFPTASWDVMQGFNDSVWRAPVLTRVRKIPSRQCTQFDVHFVKFEANAGADSINIEIPTSIRKKRPRKKTAKSRVKAKRAGKKQPAKRTNQKGPAKSKKAAHTSKARGRGKTRKRVKTTKR
jgi:hypothetical protein